MNEKEMQSFREVNAQMRDMLNNLADLMLTADADQWAVTLDYYPRDLMNATLIFMHTLSNIGIKNGTLDEQKSEEAGHRLRDLARFMTGYDTADIAAHMKPDPKADTFAEMHQHRCMLHTLKTLSDIYGENRSLGNIAMNIQARLTELEARAKREQEEATTN